MTTAKKYNFFAIFVKWDPLLRIFLTKVGPMTFCIFGCLCVCLLFVSFFFLFKRVKWQFFLILSLKLKAARSYFSKFSFLFHLKNHHSGDVKFEISVETIKPFGRTNNFVYCSCLSYCVSLIMVTITRHVFNDIFQRRHVSAVSFATAYEKKNELSCDTKICKSLKKKS